MPYTYDRSPGGDKLSVTGCDEHGGIIITAHSAAGSAAVPVCIAPADLAEVTEEMHAWGQVESYKARWLALKGYLDANAAKLMDESTDWPAGARDGIAAKLRARSETFALVRQHMDEMEAGQ
jgi:hypothetical protein